VDAAHTSAMSIATETQPVVCSRCRRTVSVLVSDLYPPSFRHVEDQAECPEIQERRGQDGGIPDLAVCDALKQSLDARLESSEVAAVAHDDIWYVVRRTPGRPSPLYSPRQARAQADHWYGRGQTHLADQFRRAADEAERRQSGSDDGVQGRARGTVTIYVMVIAVIGFAIWYFVLRPPTQVAVPTSEPVQTPAEPKAVATRTPEATPPAPQVAPTLAPQQREAVAPGPTPQVAVNTPPQVSDDATGASPRRAPEPTSNTAQSPRRPEPGTTQATPSPAGVAAPLLADTTGPTPRRAPEPTSNTAQSPRRPDSATPQTTPSSASVAAPSPAAAPPAREAAVGPVQTPSPPPIGEPEMVSLPGGTFAMGSNDDISEKPIHKVTVKPFAISKFPITVHEWNDCVAAKACTSAPTGNDDAPVTNLSWSDTQQFIAWLAEVTHKSFRLPSEAEWEYAARGGTATTYWWGDRFQLGMANCKGCGEPYDIKQPAAVSAVKPNPFGLYDMGGGVAQWVADCWHKNYRGAPADGSPWVEDSNCSSHVIRSGSWKNEPSYIRPASRDLYDTNARYLTLGFRVARSL
jgi:formylglycine-generating enzyme required for sulfatase activity